MVWYRYISQVWLIVCCWIWFILCRRGEKIFFPLNSWLRLPIRQVQNHQIFINMYASYVYERHLGKMSKHRKMTQATTLYMIFVVQLLSQIWIFATQWTAAHQAPLTSAISFSLSQIHICWDCLTISSLGSSFSFCLQSFPASGFFPVSQLFTSRGQNIGASGGQSIGASASAFQWIFRVDFL